MLDNQKQDPKTLFVKEFEEQTKKYPKLFQAYAKEDRSILEDD